MRSPARLLLSFDQLQDADPPSPVIRIDSDAVVVISLLLCAVICVIGLALVARCAWLRRSLSADPSSAAPALRKGIKKKALRALPTLTFVSSAAAAAAAEAPCGVELVDCAICLAEFADGDEVRILPQCRHGFHAACVDKWLGAHASCPSCRRILVVPAPPKRSQTCCGSSGGGAPAKSTESGGASTSKNSGQIGVC